MVPSIPSTRACRATPASGPSSRPTTSTALRRTLTRERIEAGPRTLWRYIDLLPVSSPPAGGLPVGLSPLVAAPRLAEALGLRELHIKIEAANPTHSFKDRVVSVASAKALELGLEALACASTGNLAGAVAAQAAALGLEAYIFIPADLEREKIISASVPGAHIFAVEGNYDDANRLCAELAYERPWAFVNFNVRPYYGQGSKTVAFETAEQLGWRLPDQTIAPIASGSLYTKIDRGFRELLEVGLVEGDVPLPYGAQADGLLAGRDRVRARRGSGDARSAPTRSRSRSRSAHLPTARTRSGVARRGGGAHRVRDGRRDRRGDRPARADDRLLHRDRGRRHDRDAREARARGRASIPTAAPSPT